MDICLSFLGNKLIKFMKFHVTIAHRNLISFCLSTVEVTLCISSIQIYGNLKKLWLSLILIILMISLRKAEENVDDWHYSQDNLLKLQNTKTEDNFWPVLVQIGRTHLVCIRHSRMI